MKYFSALIMMGVPDEIFDKWSEKSDYISPFTYLHTPENEVYVVDVCNCPVPEHQANQLKTNVFDERGGI